MRYTIPLLILLPAILLSSCKKDMQEILMEELSLAENASLNLELTKLRESLKDARTDFDRAVVHAKIANINSEKGNIAEAIKSSQESIKYQPNQYLSHYLLGKSYLQAGRYAEAEAELLASIELKGAFPMSHFELGNACYKLRQYARAEGEFREALKLDGTLFMAHNNMGVVKSLQGKHTDAARAFEEAVRLRPDFAQGYRNLGVLYDSKLKDRGLAVKNYRKYLEISPNCPERHLVQSWLRVLGG
jgi:tetratricopeptide (TPR) repeat protein